MSQVVQIDPSHQGWHYTILRDSNEPLDYQKKKNVSLIL